jgi:hypothetical protein
LSVTARVGTGDDPVQPVSFRRPRTLDVRVLDAAGTPLAGANVRALNKLQQAPVSSWTRTDADGRASFRGLWPEPVDVRASAPGASDTGTAQAEADLTAGDASVDVVFAPNAIVRVRVMIDGRAQLPAKYVVHTRQRVLEEFPELGELRVRVDRLNEDGRQEITLRAQGFLPAGEWVTLGTGDAEPLVVIELQRAARIVADVVAAPGASFSILADRRHEPSGEWSNDNRRGLERPNGAGGVYVFDGLGPGTYRLRDVESGFSSAEVELTAGGAARVSLDLSLNAWVQGRVEVPAGAELQRARLVVEGLPSHHDTTSWSRFGGREPNGRRLAADGSFRVAVPVDRAITLRAWHPWLVPSAEHGEVRVRGGLDGVVLTLEARGEVRIPLSRTKRPPSPIDALRVAAFRGPVSAEPEMWFHAPIESDVARFAGLAPGKWTLWIEAGSSQSPPWILTDVEIREGVTELAPLVLTRGSQVVVRMAGSPARHGDGLKCVISGVGVPLYERSARPENDGTHVLRGCAAGRHLLRITRASSVLPIERELELDGVHDVTVDIDAK